MRAIIGACFIIFPVGLILAGCQTITSTWRHADTFTHEGLLAGSVMDEVDCHWPDTSLWVMVDGQGECVRFFHAGLSPANDMVHVWFHGDRIVNRENQPYVIESAYRNNDPKTLRRYAANELTRFGLPYIRYSRPGAYGSSGDHKDRRLARESRIVNAALNALKTKFKIKRFALSGQSGGGHVVAALLARRDDIACAVITSGVVAVRHRMAFRGWTMDATGHSAFYDPIDHAREVMKDKTRRIFIVGDRDDSNVPFTTQASYYRALKNAGHRAALIEAQARGSNHHALSPAGFRIAKWCVDGDSDGVIRARLAEWEATRG